MDSLKSSQKVFVVLFLAQPHVHLYSYNSRKNMSKEQNATGESKQQILIKEGFSIRQVKINYVA